MPLSKSFLMSILCLTLTSLVMADTKIPSVLSSNMVLQREKTVPIWGWDNAGQKVSVDFNGQTLSTVTDEKGHWQVNFPAMKAGGPFKLTIQGSTRIELTNVLIGEVWLCSGQSNMEWVVRNSNNAKEEIAAANFPMIRHIKIPHRPANQPESDVPSKGWEVCSPQTVPNFTAVGYFFGRHLHQELKVPIGLIGSNWGGTRIEPWTPPEGFKKVPALKESHADKLDSFPVKNKNGQPVHQSPLALYNGMIHPLLPYQIRGAIWYQGESNNGEGMLYHEKMKALILGWREVWKNPDMPFYFVQLAPFRYGNAQALPFIWEAQLKTLSVPNTGMAVTMDISNIRDIHPRNKQDVGKRLALWALAKTYGKKDLIYSGPLYKSMKVDGNKIVVSFDHAEGLKTRDGKAPSHFVIAGADQKFVPATAKIVGQTVEVSSPDVANPVAVRYGWDQVAEPNLCNKAGLPASPFRTDNWKK